MRAVTGFWYNTIWGLRYMSLQNLAHFFQCPLVVEALIVESSLEILPAAEMKIFQKLLYLVGSTSVMADSVGV